jgi:hypothetical protein
MMDLETLTPIQEFDFVDSVFYNLEYHCKEKSRLFVSGKCNTFTRKFYISGDLREKLISNILVLNNLRKSGSWTKSKFFTK